jgi:hypothetical protein
MILDTTKLHPKVQTIVEMFQNIDLNLNTRRKLFVNFTSNYFNLTNRGVDDESIDTCSYVKGCAIGIWVDEPNSLLLDEIGWIGDVFRDNKKHLLPNWLSSLGRKFLKDIQHLHDSKAHWDEEGLSQLGEECVKRFYKRIAENYYD